MKALYVFCEGPTEQGFCNQVLRPQLFPGGEGQIHTLKIAHSRSHGVIHRGGIGKYATLRQDIKNTLKCRGERDVSFTTMIDLYKAPKDFPGKINNILDPNNPTPYVEVLEQAFSADINDIRFIPYLQLFEYETLLFADPEGFRIQFDNCDAAIDELKQIAASFPSIEHIDDGESTSPTKRIIALLPEYEGLKPAAGPEIALMIGLDVLRAKSPHFHAWVARFEVLARAGDNRCLRILVHPEHHPSMPPLTPARSRPCQKLDLY